MSFLRILAIGSFLVIFMGSCSLQKRNYRPGYYISWGHSTEKTNKTAPRQDPARTVAEIKISATSSESPSENLTAALSYVPKQIYPSVKKQTENCDTIVLRNGTEIKAKVIEINPIEVKYKYCNNPGGPNIIINKSDVRLIKYANGEKEEFKMLPEPFNNQLAFNEMYIRKQAVSSLISGIVSFFILYFGIITAILAIVRGRRALALIGNDFMLNIRYRKQARAGVILGIIYFCLIGLIILAILTI